MDSSLESSILAFLKVQYSDVETLLTNEDPPSTPYKSRYEARVILESALKNLEDNEGSLANALKIHFLARLGSIDHDVEELSKSERDLEWALKISKTFRNKSLIIIPELVCMNQLGILWSSRGDFEKAKFNLLAALESYRSFKASPDHCIIYDIHDLLDPSMAAPRAAEKMKAVEILNTHTYYYLAQACEKCGHKENAAGYCHITLRKQLELNEYQPLDWVTNAYTLSHYHLVQDKYKIARHHVAAARFVLEKHKELVELKEYPNEEEKAEAIDAVAKASANIDRAWGRYCFVLLNKSHDRFMAVSNGEQDMTLQDIESEGEINSADDFPSVTTNHAFEAIPIKLATDFAQAREIFLPGQRHLNAAKKYFTIEEHCIDYTDINQDLSTMHKYLANFEQDPDRRFKIHKRRVDLLEGPLNELNERVYLMLCRQLIFELAETHESMMDAKLDKFKALGEQPSEQTVSKVNGVIDRSIYYFTRYLDTLKNAMGELPCEFVSENVRPVLVAYFHLGRLWDKYVVAEVSEKKLQNKLKTYFYFKQLVEYCDRHPEAEEAVSGELPPSREMVKLLPIKIEKMRMELKHFQKT